MLSIRWQLEGLGEAMKNLTELISGRTFGRVCVLLCLLASLAFADSVTVKLNIFSLPNGSNSPYRAHITPQPNGTQVDLWIACLDLNRHVNANTDYLYDRTLNGGPTSWGAPNSGQPTSSTQVMYDAAALLMQQLLLEGPSFSSAKADKLSYAIWEIFDNSSASPGSDAQNWANTALVNAHTTGFVIPNYYVYTPSDSAKQRFISITGGTHRVPDGGLTVVLLGGALLGLETLRRKFRG